MSKKSNVHPDYYTGGGRDRPDDAARARLNRAIAAKATSQQWPDRMGKDFYFERPDPERDPGLEAPAPPRPKAKKKTAARSAAAGRKAPPKARRGKKAPAAMRKTRRSPAKKSRKAAARPAKKR
jgi:hypothetical protein